MPLEPRPIGINGDPFIRLERKINKLHNDLDSLKANSRPTIPIYSPSVLSDLQATGMNDGEYFIQDSDGKVYFVVSGVVKQLTSTP